MSDLPPEPKCHYCDSEAVAYCDYPLYGDPILTCSRAICNHHRRHVGHLCYRGKNKKLSDSIDYCSYHEIKEGV